MTEEVKFPTYGSIDNLYRSAEVLEEPIVATEKLHGTNVRFMWGPGGLWVGSRRRTMWKPGMTEPDKDGYGFVAYITQHPIVENVFHETAEFDNYVFYGEWHGGNIQKGVKYCDEKDFRCFDIRHPEGHYLNWDEVEEICEKVGLKIVPVLFKGMASPNDLEKLLETNSVTATENGIELEENIHEGMVIKPLKMHRAKHGEWLRAKYKSHKFAENAKAPKVKKIDPEQMAIQEAARDFAESVVTNGRVLTIIEHITRDGNTELSVKRTPDFLRAFVHDVMDEHKEIYDQLDKNQKNIYNKTVNKMAVRLWQDHLMRQ